jgi:hypothetical protein
LDLCHYFLPCFPSRQIYLLLLSLFHLFTLLCFFLHFLRFLTLLSSLGLIPVHTPCLLFSMA